MDTKRLVGIGLLGSSVLMIFVVYKGLNKGQKWAWYALLAGGLITWGGLIGYKAWIGYFRLNASSMTFIMGAIIFLIGISLSAKPMLGKKGA